MSRGKKLSPYHEQIVKAKLASICVDYDFLETEIQSGDRHLHRSLFDRHLICLQAFSRHEIVTLEVRTKSMTYSFTISCFLFFCNRWRNVLRNYATWWGRNLRRYRFHRWMSLTMKLLYLLAVSVLLAFCGVLWSPLSLTKTQVFRVPSFLIHENMDMGEIT